MISPVRSFLVSVLLAGAVSAGTAEPPGPTGVQPLPSVVQYAKAHAIPLDGFALGEVTDETRAGDRITVLFTVQEGASVRQWLGEFRSVALTGREAKAKPGTGLGILSVFQSSLKTDTGHEFRFVQIPVALEILTHGPFASDGPTAGQPTTTSTRVLATRDYLVHGLAPMAEIELRLRTAGKVNPGLTFLFRPRFSAEQMAATKARAATAGFTVDDERAYAEGFYALVQFANLAFRTDGVDAITREIADSPTLFSGAFINLVWPMLQLEDGVDWGLPGARIFQIPYNFRSKTQARGTFFVTASRPPLRNMAGIVGLTVDWTSKTPAKRLLVRVLAGRRGVP